MVFGDHHWLQQARPAPVLSEEQTPTLFLLIMFSDIGKGKLTVGKIYGGLLMLENWKATRFGNIPSQKVSLAQLAPIYIAQIAT